MTAVKRVDLRRHSAIITGALNMETAQLAAPSQSVEKGGRKEIKRTINMQLFRTK